MKCLNFHNAIAISLFFSQLVDVPYMNDSQSSKASKRASGRYWSAHASTNDDYHHSLQHHERGRAHARQPFRSLETRGTAHFIYRVIEADKISKEYYFEVSAAQRRYYP